MYTARSLHILMISPSFGSVGGAETQVNLVITELIARGNIVDLISLEGVWRFRNLESGGLVVTDRVVLQKWPRRYAHLRIMRWIIYNHNVYDVVHCHTLTLSAGSYSLICRLFNIPAFFKVTRSGEHSQLSAWRSSRLRRIIFHWCFKSDRVRLVSLTADSRQELLSLEVQNSQILDLPNGVRVTSIAKDRAPRSPLVITYVGRLIKRKRVDTLIHAFGHCRNRENALLRIVGSGPELPTLKMQVQTAGLSARVVFEVISL
jgi:glycosyltransferase involved in cell wall biosynthesis